MRRPTWTLGNEHATGLFFLAVSTIAGSTYAAFAKQLSGVLSPPTLVFISETLVLLFLCASWGLLPILRIIARTEKKEVIALVAVGILHGVMGPLLWFLSLHWTTAVNATLFGNTEIIITMALSALFLGEVLTKSRLTAASIVFCGLIVVALQGFTQGVAFHRGDLLIVVASACFAVGNIVIHGHLSNIPIPGVVLMKSTIAIVCFFLISPFLTHPLIAEVRTFPRELLLTLLGFSFISRFLNICSTYETIERMPVGIVAIFGSLTVIGSTLFSHVFLGETIAWYHLLGGAFIILGTLSLELMESKGTPKIVRKKLHTRRRHHT